MTVETLSSISDSEPQSAGPERIDAVFGSITARLFTPPLVTGPPGPCGCGCALTPETSYGFDVEVFAKETVKQPLDPWQRWCAIHLGELLPDGRPRFRKVLILVARQNGKTELLVILTLFWLYVDQYEMVLGTSTKLDYAKESWLKVVKKIKKIKALAALLPPTRNRGIRKANGETEVAVLREVGDDEEDACRYKIAPANEEGGRSLTIPRAILDELRQHHDYSAWDAIVPAQNAVPDAQTIAITNAGSDKSIVLNDKREEALNFIKTGDGDDRLGIFEYSAPDGADPEDPQALAQANPNLGYRIDVNDLLSEARAAKRKGGEALAGFRTEIMCQRVRMLDPAIDPEAWKGCFDAGTLDALRKRVALCMDVSLDGLHATVCAAAVMPDNRVRVEPVAAWEGVTAARDMARDLPALVAKVRPQVVGWFPGGPGAALAADLSERKGTWPPSGVTVTEIRGDTTAVCMGFADLVAAGQVAHSDDPLLNEHIALAERYWQGDAWRFIRKGTGQCDAVYAAAGAAHLARTMPKPLGKPRIILPSSV